ncbi:hypothetical protein GSI_14282 [Ganoderma sinense ZZ0214-1]|uniref:Uncharacterized protein n=1 Tax=Ganoderma sinense ZZ0214-1 TaxID=1077348 RepID=A0A2G8RSN2_9APHY|nr:hypothetical protein GSI_14282 [Ganoderma sinense ZZ0214-1]
MQANPYSSYQSSGEGDDQQQSKPSKPWKGRLQSEAVGNYYSITIDGVTFVGLAIEAVESAGGEYFRLQYLGNHRRDILRHRLTLVSGAAMTGPPPVQAIPNALQETAAPQEPDYPGTSHRTRARPYLNQ